MSRHTLHNHLKRQHHIPPELWDWDVDGTYLGYLATLTNDEMEVAHLIAHTHDLIEAVPSHQHPKEDYLND